MTTSGAEIQKLASLLDMSQALSGTLKLKDALHRVLEILERHHSVVRGAVTLRDGETRALAVEAVLGAGRGRHAPGEGVAERVAESGKPVVIPQASLEPSLGAPARRGKGAGGETSII